MFGVSVSATNCAAPGRCGTPPAKHRPTGGTAALHVGYYPKTGYDAALRYVKSWAWATSGLMHCSEPGSSANHSSLATPAAVGFREAREDSRDATAGVHRGSARISPGKGNENVI
jgi:hypothetical protein